MGRRRGRGFMICRGAFFCKLAVFFPYAKFVEWSSCYEGFCKKKISVKKFSV